MAALLGAPVILVVDARGQSHSVAALLHGFSTFDPAIRIAGVILNRVGSPRHEEVLRQACEHAGVPVLGAIPRVDELSVPSRHLGLVTAVEHGQQARVAVEAMIGQVGRHVDLAGWRRIAASRVSDEPWDPVVGGSRRRRRHRRTRGGQGVQFRLRRALRTAARRRCRGRGVRPAGRPAAAADRRAGAYPAASPSSSAPNCRPMTLCASRSRRSPHAGAPVHAECAGLTYLVDDLDGHPMCGVLSGSARFTDRLTLGYRNAVAVADSSLYAIGDRTVGHEFHRTAVTFNDSYAPAWVYRGRDVETVTGRRRRRPACMRAICTPIRPRTRMR